jgi:hypothetical protein
VPVGLGAQRRGLGRGDSLGANGIGNLSARFVERPLGPVSPLLSPVGVAVRDSQLFAQRIDGLGRGACRPEEAKVLSRAIALVNDPDPHVRAQAIGLA